MTTQEIARHKEIWRIAQEEYRIGMQSWAEAWADLSRTRKPSLRFTQNTIESRIMLRTGATRVEARSYYNDMNNMEHGM